jgi:hypothetical protein
MTHPHTTDEEIEDLERITERGMYWVRLDRVRDVLSQVRKEAYEDVISHIGHDQGWEESEDVYRKHFGLPTKYDKKHG